MTQTVTYKRNDAVSGILSLRTTTERSLYHPRSQTLLTNTKDTLWVLIVYVFYPSAKDKINGRTCAYPPQLVIVSIALWCSFILCDTVGSVVRWNWPHNNTGRACNSVVTIPPTSSSIATPDASRFSPPCY